MGYEAYNNVGGYMQLLHREWELLLELAERQGWQPGRNREDYARGGPLAEGEAASMTAALERALPDIPGHYAHDSFTAAEKRLSRARTLPERLQSGEAFRKRPGDEQGDPLAYFSGGNRNTVRQFIEIASGAGGFTIRPLPGYGGEF